MSKTGYIYKLVCSDVEIKECYVGGTINFRNRKCDHKNVCNNSKGPQHNFYVYQFIREHGGWTNWDMVQIEEFKHDTKRQLNARERYWIETLQATLNTNIPTRTKKEYYIDNKDEILERNGKYRELHKEQILEKNKEWREKNKEQISEKNKEWRDMNKEQISEKNKEYREANRTDLNKYLSNYYQKNKAQLLNKMKIKTTCECGSIVSKSDLNKHLRTQKHKDFISVPHTV